MSVLKPEGQKYKNKFNRIKKCVTINTGSDVMKTAQPIRNENYPHLPSNPL
jgi:hypothetical protein